MYSIRFQRSKRGGREDVESCGSVNTVIGTTVLAGGGVGCVTALLRRRRGGVIFFIIIFGGKLPQDVVGWGMGNMTKNEYSSSRVQLSPLEILTCCFHLPTNYHDPSDGEFAFAVLRGARLL
jgi:hypothetical protein